MGRGFLVFSRSSVMELPFKRTSFHFVRSASPVRPLCSAGITPLPHYYGPVRLPDRTAPRLLIPLEALRIVPHPAGPPRFLGQSFSARHLQSPRRAQRLHLPVASTPVIGFTTFGRLATLSCVTRPNRVRLRYGSHFRQHGASAGRITPSAARVTTGTNRQFPWRVPFNLRD